MQCKVTISLSYIEVKDFEVYTSIIVTVDPQINIIDKGASQYLKAPVLIYLMEIPQKDYVLSFSSIN